MLNRSKEIKQGKLSFPNQIISILGMEDEVEVLNDFFNNLFYNFLLEKEVDSLTWLERIGEVQFISVLSHLSKSGWITSKVENNFASISLNESKLLKWVTKNDLTKLKFDIKLNKHKMEYSTSRVSDLVSINYAYNVNSDTLCKQYMKTGLVRKGFMKASNHSFSYDVNIMAKYKDMIVEKLIKDQVTSTKEIIHPEVIASLIDDYILLDENYTVGRNISDSRGRAIFDSCRKVFNPISSKEARACLMLPKDQRRKLDSIGEETVFTVIAELLGARYLGEPYTTYENKVSLGYQAYISRTMPELCLEELHEYIWLDRIYANLDRHFISNSEWVVPIELDSTASALAIMGVLTNDHTYMDLVNLIGDELKDAWTVDYVSRTHVKKAVTPAIYGSSANANDLWDKAKLEYTQQQLNDMNYDLAMGRYANAIQFKDFIITNVQTKPKMKVRVWNDEFEVYCNKFHWESTTMKSYRIYTSEGKVKRITREVAMKYDLEQFKRFFATLLCHGIDSQIANSICEELDWVISVHDAWTIHPNSSLDLREIFLSNIIEIYDSRKEILSKYFNSIGIDQTYDDVTEEEVTHFTGNNLK